MLRTQLEKTAHQFRFVDLGIITGIVHDVYRVVARITLAVLHNARTLSKSVTTLFVLFIIVGNEKGMKDFAKTLVTVLGLDENAGSWIQMFSVISEVLYQRTFTRPGSSNDDPCTGHGHVFGTKLFDCYFFWHGGLQDGSNIL